MKTMLFILMGGLFLANAGCAGLRGEGENLLCAREVIKYLDLQPMSDDACPGFFKATYESGSRADVGKERAAASLIYYLMTAEVSVDPWHVLTSDEVLLYHAGAPMIQMLLYEDGSWEEVVLGPEADKGQVMQKVIPAGTWMGFVRMSRPEYDWGLYGVMVVPGWHIEDIRMIGEGDELERLKAEFPTAVPRGRELGLF